MLNELRDWSMWLAEWLIVGILVAEYRYDQEKDERKQRKTKTTKKTTTTPAGESVTTEETETIESKGEPK